MKRILLTCLLPLLIASTSFTIAFSAEPMLKDDFSDAALAARKATRGTWTYADGVATCTQDDELYRKNKDHGPILFYDLAYTDAVLHFRFKATEAKSVVFTANGDSGHVFRFVLGAAGLNVRAFPPGSEEKSTSLGLDKEIKLRSGEWVGVTVTLKGETATIKMGAGSETTYTHPSLARSKVNFSVGFSFGTLSVSDVLATTL
jgi:hypothetical protein